jgi:hypothetical protein
MPCGSSLRSPPSIVVGYFVAMRVFFKESKELDKKIDYGKMKEWKDDAD